MNQRKIIFLSLAAPPVCQEMLEDTIPTKTVDNCKSQFTFVFVFVFTELPKPKLILPFLRTSHSPFVESNKHADQNLLPWKFHQLVEEGA